MTPDFQDNRQIRIFISSTFRDMMDERGYLVTRVFPALRRFCEERDISLFELDLRWGVTQEESENQMAFKICLNEVDNTRPFFIGLLGERYGWIPDEETQEKMKLTKVFDEYEWLLAEIKKKKSITEAEIHEGAFLSDDKINAYFYIRSPKMKTPDEFKEENGSHSEKMLLELKERIRKDTRYTVKDYDSVEHLGNMIEKDFKTLVNSIFPEKKPLSVLEKERMQQRIFLKSRTRSYIENPEWMKFLDEFAESGETTAVVTGESGMGKSALLANWIANRQKQKTENEKIIYHFTGISMSGGDHRRIIRRLIDEINDIFIFAEEEEKDTNQNFLKTNKGTKNRGFIPFIFKFFSGLSGNQDDKLQDEFQEALNEIPKDQKLIIALDSLDRLVDAENSKMLHWIPSCPPNVKFIFSSMSGDKSMEALTRLGYRQLVTDALPPETRKKIIIKYFEKFSKKLDSRQIEKIISDKKSQNPLVLLAILDDLRIFGNYDIFDRQIEEHLAQENNEKLFDNILQNIESVFNESNSANLPKNIVKDILSLLAVSRHGLTETEIVNISKVPKLYWSQLFNCMSSHLLLINGLVTFSSGIMLNAVINRCLKDNNEQRQYRKAIASYMETENEVSFNRRCDELPFQLFELKDLDKLHNFLACHNVFNFIFEKDMYELGKYWRALRLSETKRYSMEIYLEHTGDENDELTHFYHRVCMLLITFDDFETGIKFAKKTEELCGKLNIINLDNLNMIAGCYGGIGEYENAVKYYKKALTLNDKYQDKNQNNYNADKIMFLSGIGNNYKRLNNYKEAIVYLYDALELTKKIYGDDNPVIAAMYDSIGMCYEDLGDYIKAHDHYCYALEINEKYYGKGHISSELTYNNFGSVFMKMGRYRDAAEDFLKAIDINRKYYSADHPNVAASINSLGSCMEAMGDYKQALVCYNNALNINRKLFGVEHNAAAHSCNNIGSCYYALGDIENAFKYYRDALLIKEKILGKGHADTAQCYNNIAKCFFSFNQVDDALEAFHNALNILEKTAGSNHPYTAFTYNQLASCYYSLGVAGKSLEFYKKAFSVYILLEEFEEQTDNIKLKINELENIIKGDSNAGV